MSTSHLTFNHYSRDNNLVLKNDFYDQSMHFKPRGLWLAQFDDWKKTCEDIGIGCGKNKYEMLIDMTDIIVIDTTEKLIEFTEKYINKYFIVNWKLVFETYKGIYVNNYDKIKFELYEKYKSINSIKYSWFYACDVSSCCVNDISCVVNYKHVED